MKETKKQIKAQVINEVRNQYDKKLKEKDEAIDLWRKKYLKSEEEWHEMSKSCRQLRDENETLKQKLSQYEEWVERMQEFCNLPEDERKQAFRTYLDGIKSRKERDEAMKGLSSILNHCMSLFF